MQRRTELTRPCTERIALVGVEQPLMREAALREYAEFTRRELSDLRRKVTRALESRKRRQGTAMLTQNLVLAVDEPEPEQRSRSDLFTRELGERWVEVEPGIYEHAGERSSEPALRLASH